MKMFFFVIAVIIYGQHCGFSQESRIAFYNVENLFDTRDDSLANDEEFTPDGARHWTEDRCRRKIVRIYQVLVALGQGELPVLAGLCEIENRQVLNRLVYDTPLGRLGYRVIHRDSPDRRGIDVALLYRFGLFEPDTSEWLTVILPDGGATREILKVTGKLWNECPVVVYVNHWPSRYGGAGSSAPGRMKASSTLAESVMGVLAGDPLANIVIMGDFNDEPGDASLQALEAISSAVRADCGSALVNVSGKLRPGQNGTIKHQGTWALFDQFLVSCSMVSGLNGLELQGVGMQVFDAAFLLEPDMKYSGDKLFRTYVGPAYHGGFSDHLPVSIVVAKCVRTVRP